MSTRKDLKTGPETANGTSQVTLKRPVAGMYCPAAPDALKLFFLFVRCAGAHRSDEQLLAVLERDVAAVGAVRAVLGLITLDEDFRARQERRLGPAAAQQRVRRAGLDHPVRDGAVGVLDVE